MHLAGGVPGQSVTPGWQKGSLVGYDAGLKGPGVQSPEVANERQVLQHSALVQGGDDGWQCSGGSSPEPSTTCADRWTKSTATKPEGQMKVEESLSRKGTGKVEQSAASVPDGCVEGNT